MASPAPTPTHRCAAPAARPVARARTPTSPGPHPRLPHRWPRGCEPERPQSVHRGPGRRPCAGRGPAGLADVRRSGATGMAAAAADVPLAADEIAYGQPGHARGEAGDRTAELMTDDPRRNNAGAGPRVPHENVKIRPTDPTPEDFDQNLPRPGPGHRYFCEF